MNHAYVRALILKDMAMSLATIEERAGDITVEIEALYNGSQYLKALDAPVTYEELAAVEI